MTRLKPAIFKAATVGVAVIAASLYSVNPAEAAPTIDVQPTANTCHLPTHATPPSRFIRSYRDCNRCVHDAFVMTTTNPFDFRYYCTYNPSNNLNDLHQYLG